MGSFCTSISPWHWFSLRQTEKVDLCRRTFYFVALAPGVRRQGPVIRLLVRTNAVRPVHHDIVLELVDFQALVGTVGTGTTSVATAGTANHVGAVSHFEIVLAIASDQSIGGVGSVRRRLAHPAVVAL